MGLGNHASSLSKKVADPSHMELENVFCFHVILCLLIEIQHRLYYLWETEFQEDVRKECCMPVLHWANHSRNPAMDKVMLRGALQHLSSPLTEEGGPALVPFEVALLGNQLPRCHST